MTYSPVGVDGFKGLNLADDPDDVGLDQLRDGLNVDTADQGRLRPRVGYGVYNSTTLSLMRRFGRYVFATSDVESYRIDTQSATFVPLSGGKAADFASAGQFGEVYSCLDTRPLRKASADTGPFGSNIAGTPAGNLLAATPLSDRLAIARQPGDLSKVSFSSAIDPASWATNDNVRLTPGDGQSIQAFATFDNALYVFKESKFFIFSGESTRSDGTPLFNFRMVDTGKGCAVVYGAVGSPEGVYFIGKDGIYLTSGGPPRCISDAIRPLFTAGPLAATTTLAPINPANAAYLTYHENRLYFSDTTNQLLVYDPRTEDWLAWRFANPVSWGLGDCVGTAPTNDNQVLWTARDGTGLLAQVGTELTDNGTAITSYARSGLSDLGTDAVKTIREAELRGTGTVTFALLGGAGGTPASVAMDGRHRVAYRGARVGWQVQGSGAWRLDGLTLRMREVRVEGAS